MHTDNNVPDAVQSTAFFATRVGTAYSAYISGTIESPSNYIDLFNLIRNLGPDDSLTLHINSHGGDVSTAIQMIRCMGESAGTITCSVEGNCMSAATMIFLSADKFEITALSSFLIHNYSGGTFGKGNEMHSQIDFERQWSKNLFNEVYAGFLTKSEIKEVLDGKDIWLSHEDVAERVTARETKRLKHPEDAK